jgi:hypothetical protein
MRRILDNNTDYLPGDPQITDSSVNNGKIGPETLGQLTDLNFIWPNGSGINRPFANASSVGSAPSAGFDDTFVARWTRTVTLNPGTYSFSTISDDGVNVILSDTTGTTGLTATTRTGMPNAGYIINDWSNHAPKLDYGTFTVSTAMTRTLVVEFYENTGGAEIILNATSSTYSFTDSPNTPSGVGFTQVNSIYPGNSSLMLNGYFAIPSGSTTAALSYKRLYDLGSNSTFYVEASTDGGFTWSQIATETLSGATKRMPPGNTWQQQGAALTSSTYTGHNVIIRFRLDTRTASTTNDGMYLTDIRITS